MVPNFVMSLKRVSPGKDLVSLLPEETLLYRGSGPLLLEYCNRSLIRDSWFQIQRVMNLYKCIKPKNLRSQDQPINFHVSQGLITD